ncbi:hypothetical protein Enr13x_39290 [Stieleria neptunia]|uniref:Uncharacterized protein n=1 Tax=Stieleria neptunia TaxID=2527979 RepID=A0A518HT92_9BACT|nr:hypothetical protein Enr13x_39290 [Stieleria neptunia]
MHMSDGVKFESVFRSFARPRDLYRSPNKIYFPGKINVVGRNHHAIR